MWPTEKPKEPEKTKEFIKPEKPEKLLPAIKLGPYEPIIIKTSDGRPVETIAIHAVSPEGLTFSPTPSAPLIGSNTLQKVTTAWENIDSISISPYRELYRAYKRALKGESLVLEIGPHFDELSYATEKVRTTSPSVRLYYADGSSGQYNFSNPTKRSTLNTSIRGWSMRDSTKARVMDNWAAVKKELEPMLYRRDVILLTNKLDRGIRAIDKILPQSTVFNISSARDIHELISQE